MNMKMAVFAFMSLAVLSCMSSCTKKISSIYPINNGVYSKWYVSQIAVSSVVVPQGVVWDTTYNAKATDYIDLSTKGSIDFYINLQHHIDTYDTAKYDLLKDTLVATNSGPGFHYVSVTAKSNGIAVKESTFGVDAGTNTVYNLHK